MVYLLGFQSNDIVQHDVSGLGGSNIFLEMKFIVYLLIMQMICIIILILCFWMRHKSYSDSSVYENIITFPHAIFFVSSGILR